MKFTSSRIKAIIKEELELEAKRRQLKAELKEIQSLLNEIDNNIPTGVNDPGDRESLHPIIVSSYKINDETDSALVSFADYYKDMEIDLDNLVSFYEKIKNTVFPTEMSLPEILVILTKNEQDFKKLIELYIERNKTKDLESK